MRCDAMLTAYSSLAMSSGKPISFCLLNYLSCVVTKHLFREIVLEFGFIHLQIAADSELLIIF